MNYRLPALGLFVAALAILAVGAQAVSVTPTKNIYSGVAALDKYGEVTIVFPPSVMERKSSFTYQAKGVRKPMPNLYIKSEMIDDRFTIAGGVPGGEIAWELVGTENHL